jgi:outer membrane receptor protein involved in Fe transport
MFRATRCTRVLAVLVFLLSAGLAHAQVDRATLSGIVRDPSDAVIQNARVTVTNLATGIASTVETSATGTYLVMNLMPGEYLVQAEATGFQRFEQTVALEVGARARLDLSLPVGSIGETVKVEGVTPLLSTESAVLGTVVDSNEIDKLPLAIRNWDDLLAMVPGVQSDRYSDQVGGTPAGRTGGVSVHGNRSLQNNFLLDGVANNSFSTNVQELTTQISRPSVDAIDEFKVVTSPYAAEYGWSPGAAIIVNTKSGTNSLHGTAYDFFRDDRFDAINFFAKRANQPKAKNNQNQFGGNLGGPLMRNRAFFFGDYEGTRIAQGVLRTGRVMTANERAGIFGTTTIRDPLTGQPFPNNTIPANRIDPVAARIVAMLPLPNTTGGNNFIRQPNVEDESDRYLGRVDVRLTANDNVFARYIYSDRFRYVPGWFGGLIDGTSTSAWGRNFLKSHGAVAGWTKVLGSSLVNEARFSFARGTNDGTQDPFGQSGMGQIGFRGVPDDPRVAGGIVGVDIDGHIRIGSPNFMPKFQHTDQFQYLNTLTWLKGRHQWKFGADVMAPMRNEYFDVAPTRGNLRFQSTFTGNAFADFLIGYPNRAELTNVFVADQRLWSTSFYVQDDWKASDALTLNLGLRYDFMTPATEATNQLGNFDPSGDGRLIFASDGSLADRALVNPDKNNFAPRIGAIYKLDDQTLVRGGYGVFYNQFDRIGSEDQLAVNPPGVRNIQVNSPTGATTPVLRMQDGFPANYLDPSNLVIRNLKLRAAAQDSPRTIVQQFGAGIERQIGRHFVVSADAIGSFTQNLAILRNLNQPLPGTRDANGPVPYPNFGNIQLREMTGEANYKGMDFSFERRFNNGYSYRASYTIGSTRDQAPEHLNASSGRAQNGRDLESWEGPSDFDVRHRIVSNFIVELPFGEGKPFAQQGIAGKIFGGWLVSGIFSARTGRPFTVTQGNNNVGADQTGQPNLTGDPKGAGTADQWFNPAAFTQVPSGTFGNAGRNTLRGPGMVTYDTSVQRRIRFTDRINATLRWDVFNVFNRANLGLPESNVATATAGVISTLAGDPRVMQFSLRLGF